ncbi:unnamed protein product [Aureobasidium vineae]|uniref:Uncharacterized protein n=1 Tax=Aureobasidium vineae TaxID=2773715 RepID=A0A9N8K0M3_9PEZI|nr:unnamed protein product [Aureobasidium vineae]
MCQHFARRGGSTIRTRQITRVAQSYSEGTGVVRSITFVKAVSKDTYEGRLGDGKRFRVTKDDISTDPSIYQLGKEPGHHNCYQLIFKAFERYRELKMVKPACGPKQQDIPNRPKKVFYFCDGESITDLELKEDEDIDEFNIVEIKDRDDDTMRRYLRETGWVSSNKTTQSDGEED